MSGHGLTQQAAIHGDHRAAEVIENYLTGLAQHLPARAPVSPDMIAELRSDLLEATEAELARHADAADAARAAIADFGDARTVAAALAPELTARRARRLGLLLLASGPVIGACWLAALALSGLHTSTPGVALLLAVAPFLLIGAPATAVTVASSGRLTRRLTPQSKVSDRALLVARLAAGAGDAVLLASSLLILLIPGVDPSPALAVAAAASLARLGFILYSTGWFARSAAPRTASQA